jgi:hypothetical protein
VLLTYLDESYTKDRFYIAALGCPDEVAIPLASDLDQVVQDAATAYAVAPTAELHGHALFAGKDDWKDLAPAIRARIGVYDKAMEAIGRYAVRIFLCGVDIPALRRRYSYPEAPHSVVLQHVLERVNAHARSTPERVLVIADEVAEADSHRQALIDYRRYGTPGYLSSTLGQVVDTIHFVPSYTSRLLQAADLIAFLHRRRETHTESDKRAQRANDRIWGHIEPRIVHQRLWVP